MTEPDPPAADRARARGERTRSAIIETALRLFDERGYDKTTMRAIAAEAGVSVGNAYYYFASKDHLIQGFYLRMAEAHEAIVLPRLTGVDDLSERLAITLDTWLDVAEPYHRFAGQFFRNAADPASPLSPFSPESAEARSRGIALYREVLAGVRVSPDLRETLPELLWLYQMGVCLYWVYDRTAGQERSRGLARRTAPLVGRLVGLSRWKVVRPLVRQVEGVIRDYLVSASVPADSVPADTRATRAEGVE
ncbi:TetR family transcriptional regulator [Actinorhabdospora filicis]|uniref:TetR family transcriptional regulator n=1 Tax=Actinorhabdospora filicis TaxID=1785913 RepID=A0A9W6WCW8_9ACTN|nr:TetR family transcriptional regulator [Actinorhabdospora filicis]GLZ82039.1 TetR family transcriptional regulator [Actinorhabdospora filicis]